jgi:hypothetical protein
MIGDFKAYERASAKQSPAFSTCKVIEIEAAGLKPDPTSRQVLLIDARGIIAGHNDVRNDEVGRLVWTLMRGLAPR